MSIPPSAQFITRNLCNDLNRLATVNLITFGFDTYLGKRQGSFQAFQAWKDGFLRDIIVLMIYHQLLHVRTAYLDRFSEADAGMIDD